MDFLSRPSIALPVTIFTLWVSYCACLVVYRLYLHPLARFPGPKLAALSKYYEFYFEVIRRGQFTFQTQALHKKYGSIPARAFKNC